MSRCQECQLNSAPSHCSGIGLADVVAEKQEPAAVPLDSKSAKQLSERLTALESQATKTLQDQVHHAPGYLLPERNRGTVLIPY